MEPKVLPLVQAIGARYQSLTVDSRLVNAFGEAGQRKGETYVYKRPGFHIHQALGAGIARGLFTWNDDVYAIVEGTLFRNGASVGAVQNAGVYSFTSTLGATPTLFLHNNQLAYTYTVAGGVVQVVDADYPGTTTSGTVYLNGTVYVFKPASADIIGSTAAANDPSAWDPLNFIKAQIEPMKGVYLAKNLVYVLAIKEHYTEAFYDAGNPTGSPLAPVQGAKMNFGCVDANTVRDVGGDLIWVADSGEGYPCVVMVSNLKVEIISTPQIDRLLAMGRGSWASWNCRIAGHRFYGVTNFGATIPPDPPFPDFTLVYDLTSRLWYQWTSADGGHLPYIFSTQFGTEMLFLHESNGNIVNPEESRFKDEDDPNGQFTMSIYTPNYDAETRLVKTLSQMTVIGDQAATTIQMAYSDDDYATWSNNFPFDMSLDRADQVDLGAFTKRAFRFQHTDNTPCRIESVELYLTGGVAP